jgi:hypothetical protein
MKKLTFLFSLLFAASASAQQVSLSADFRDFAAGAGFLFNGEEAQAFDVKAIYGAFHWNGLKLPGPDVSTGIGVEFHPASISVDGTLVNVDYRLWNLNRMDCAPGNTALYCGVDLKIGEGVDGGYKADFDQRVVVGIGLFDGDIDLNLELYMLEDDRPVAAAVMVRFGGPKSAPASP